MSFRGFIEDSADLLLSGWAVSEDGESCELVLEVNGTEVAHVRSDGRRGDLERQQISAGQGGFKVDVSPHLKPGENAIRLLFPDGKAVRGGVMKKTVDAPAKPQSQYQGFVEKFEAANVRGWALDREGEPCAVSASVNGATTLTVESNGKRSDLVRRGISKGLGGFSFNLEPFLKNGANTISISFPDGEQLKGTPFKVEHSKPAPAPMELPDRHIEHLLIPPKEAVQAPPQPKAKPPQVAKAVPIKPKVSPAQPTPADVRPAGVKTAKPKMPSLMELDELSLDDLSLAVAAGFVKPVPVAPEPEEVAAQTREDASEAPARDQPQGARGLLRKLFGRSRK